MQCLRLYCEIIIRNIIIAVNAKNCEVHYGSATSRAV
jgi:hypothetical protein